MASENDALTLKQPTTRWGLHYIPNGAVVWSPRVFLTKGDLMQQKQKIWTPIVHFAAHTFVGSIIFLIVGLAAVGLSDAS